MRLYKTHSRFYKPETYKLCFVDIFVDPVHKINAHLKFDVQNLMIRIYKYPDQFKR